MHATVLLPYQQRWIADHSPLKIAEKSRRTGLTWAEAADAVLTAAASKAAGGSDHFYVGAGKDMAIEFIDACAMWARAFDRACSSIAEEVLEDEDKDILTYIIRFRSGFKIQALSSSPSNLRGRQGSVTIDEAAFHEHLAEVLKAALALTMWGAKVRIISTHNGVDNRFNELINDSRAGKKRYSVHRVTLDDACADGLYKRICEVNGQPWTQVGEDQWKANLLRDTATQEDALEEYYCVPKQGGGAYLTRALIEACMVDAPVIRYQGSAEFNAWPEPLRRAEIADWCECKLRPQLLTLNPKERHVFGEDFGRSGDLSVIAPMAIGAGLQRRVPFLVEEHNVPFKQQEQILRYLVDRLPRLAAGKLDARGNGQFLAEVAADEYGSARIEQVMLSNAWYLMHMPPMKAAFEDHGIEIPRDSQILDDLRAIQSIRGIPKVPDGNTGRNGHQRHGDAAVAICLAYAASQEDPIAYDGYEAVGNPMINDDHHQDDVRSGIGFGRIGGGIL